MDSVPSSGAMGGYPDSIDSSPRSRGGESWDEPFSSSSSRLRLMCSYGGRIVPRPTDKSLCYLAGETRIVVVDRHSSLADLQAKLSRTLLSGQSFTLKYQLPNEDLDSLISVSTDEDLENMVDEYDRILNAAAGGGGSTGSAGGGSSRTSRIRLFLFPAKPDSASSMGSLMDDSTKSETWFVDALNSAMGTIDGLPRGMSADSTSVNCLLGLEEDSSVHSRPAGVTPAISEQKIPRPDVHSVPDSPMLDKSSSFGSTSSAPSLSNLPPIRVRPDDRPPDHRAQANLEDHFANMTIGNQAAELAAAQPVQVNFQTHLAPPAVPVPVPVLTPPSTVPTPPAFSPSENPNRVISDDEKSDHGAGSHRAHQIRPTETPLSDQNSRPVYYQQERASNEQMKPVSNENTYQRVPAPVQEPQGGYMYTQMTHQPPQVQIQQTPHQAAPHQQQTAPPHQQAVPHQQQQFIPANPQYIHHAPSGTYVPVPSYYPQQSHPFDQTVQNMPNMPMYYVPVRQNPNPYNLGPVPTVPPVPTVQAVPTKTGAQPYPQMGYQFMQNQMNQMSQSPAGFGYEFADPNRAAVYYSQAGTNNVSPQYQTVTAVSQQMAESVQVQSEMKQHRQT